MAKHI